MGFLSKLFGAQERPLPEIMQRMERRTKLASIALLYTLMDEVGVDRTRDHIERERLANRAGYQAKLLLSEPLSNPEYRDISEEAEALNAAVFMEKNPLMLELVVQTLRVKNTIFFARHGEPASPLIGADFLGHYGTKVKQEPDPDSYADLLKKVIDSMSDIGKARMVEFLKDTDYSP